MSPNAVRGRFPFRANILLALLFTALAPQIASSNGARKAVFLHAGTNDFSSGAAASFSSECTLRFHNPSPHSQEISLRWRNPGSRVAGLNAGDGTSGISLAGATSDLHAFTLAAGASQTLTITFPAVAPGAAGTQTATCAGEIIARNSAASPGYISVTGSLTTMKESRFSQIINGKPLTGARYNVFTDEILINGGRPI